MSDQAFVEVHNLLFSMATKSPTIYKTKGICSLYITAGLQWRPDNHNYNNQLSSWSLMDFNSCIGSIFLKAN